jgi:eukaryotic-like serine/threonine-protein kinase
VEHGQQNGITRRGLLAGGAALAVGASQAGTAYGSPRALSRFLAAEVAGASGWPTAGHDLSATRDGSSLSATAVRWTAHFPGGVPATAAISGGHVYVASGSGEVAALRLSNGSALWRRQLGTAKYGSGKAARELGFFGAVAIASGSVIAASDRVYCLDASTGATKWVTTPLRTATSDDYFWGAPVVVGGVVLLGSGSGAETPNARGKLTAYRLSDGALVWSTPMTPVGGNGGGIIGPSTVDPSSGAVYVATGAPYKTISGSNPGTCSLFELNLSDGQVVWQDQIFRANSTGFDFNSAPVIVGRRLFATNKDGIFAWDRVARKRLWHQRLTNPLAGGLKSAGPTGGPEGGPIATDGHRIYVLSNDIASMGCVAAALHPQTGKVYWRTALAGQSYAAPAVAGKRLCVPGADGNLRVLNTGTGKIVATVSLGSPSSAAPALSGGKLVVGTGAAPYIPGASLVCVG